MAMKSQKWRLAPRLIALMILAALLRSLSVPILAAPPTPVNPAVPASLQEGSKSPVAPIRPEAPTLSLLETELSSEYTYTWMQGTSADWKQGTLSNLDSTSVSGTLKLIPRYSTEYALLAPQEVHSSCQYNPDIAIDDAGTAYAIWEDLRNGNLDIYFAYRPTGGSWSTSVRVNDDIGTASQSHPTLAVDDEGNVYAAWYDSRNENFDLYFAYRPAGGNWGTNVRINDVPARTPGPDPFDLVVDSAGNAGVVWGDGRNGDLDIYFAYRPADGNWGTNLKINDDVGRTRQSTPALTIDGNGAMYAVWRDDRNGDSDIYFASRSPEGRWSPNTKVNDDTPTSQDYPSIAVDNNGNTYAAWADSRNGNWDIYFSYRPAGGTWETDIKVNDDTGTTTQYQPTIAVDGIGNTYLIWLDDRIFLYDVYFSHRPAGGNWTANTKVNDDPGSSHQRNPTFVVDNTGNAYAIWEDERNSRTNTRDGDIYFAYRPAGNAWGANTKASDDPTGAIQSDPAIAVNSAGETYALWTDMRNGNGDIYFASHPKGSPWGTNVKINDDSGAAGQGEPALTLDSAGNAYAIWVDSRLNDHDAYFAYRPAGGSWGPNSKVTDDAPSYGIYDPDIAVDGSGNAYAVWMDYRSGINAIYFAYRPAEGNWSANVKITDDAGTEYKGSPKIGVDSAGNAYAIWQDWRDGNCYLYFAYRPAGGTWSANTKVANVAGSSGQFDPDLVVNSAGNAYVVWREERSSQQNIYFSYRLAGGSWYTGTPVNDNVGSDWRADPKITIDDNGMIYIVWHESEDFGNSQIYLTKGTVGGSWGPNIRVTNGGGDPVVGANTAGVVSFIWLDTYPYMTERLFSAQLLSPPAYQPTGVYTSPELNTGILSSRWDHLTYSATIPSGTGLRFETRSRLPGADWSGWQAINQGGIASPVGQYFQYRIFFTTTTTNTTPILDWVRVQYQAVSSPSAPHFVTPCGTTNQTNPVIYGSTAANDIVLLTIDGTQHLVERASDDGTFSFQPTLTDGTHILTLTARTEVNVGPASPPFTLTVDTTLPYDPIRVRAGQWSSNGWGFDSPRDNQGCANPHNWQVWPRPQEKFLVQVPVSYTTSAMVSVTVGTQTIALTEGSNKIFSGIFLPPLFSGAFEIQITADGVTTSINGDPLLINPNGFVYEIDERISNTIPGVQVTCYYSDAHSGQWLIWDAWHYGQANPQITLEDGYYSFYTPAGLYRLVAKKAGYPIYTSTPLVMVDAPLRHNILLRSRSRIYLPLVIKMQP